MFSGFDFGTSNCAIGVMDAGVTDSTIRLLPIDQNQSFMPSVLYALERELICESVARNIANETERERYIALRSNALRLASTVRQQADIDTSEKTLFVGREAFNEYLDLPEEGYFVKSPKSFLGASGLREEHIHFFEDIVTAMMLQIKQRAEQDLNKEITQTVIGRPVNFQGLNAEESNEQALDVLRTSAQRAGFTDIEFLFEPIAAGLDFEQNLDQDKIVLVVDIGGGTSDCAMVQMGPGFRNKVDRSEDFLGHTGERVGGNDLDIQIAGKHLMLEFGMQSVLKSGLPMPTQNYWDAISTNDVNAQTRFASAEVGRELKSLLRDAQSPELLKRFIQLHQKKQNHRVVRCAEQCKIALSDALIHDVNLDFIEDLLTSRVTREQFADSIESPLAKMLSLMEEAIHQANCQPDAIYITGGSGQSAVIREAIQNRLGEIPIFDGNHFGSVASGLTVWAQRLFL